MSGKHTLSALLLLASLVISAQEKPPVTDPPKPKPEAVQKLEEAASSASAPVDPNAYQLGAEDVIQIRVFGNPELSGYHVVRPDGKITLPLFSDIQAAGLTPVQLAKNVTERVTAMLKDPRVDVFVTQVNSKRYYVQGEVNKSGPFPLVVPTTVMEAISACGGFRDFANKKNIIILRKGQRLKFNWEEVIKGKKLEQNIYLEHGDYIIVR